MTLCMFFMLSFFKCSSTISVMQAPTYARYHHLFAVNSVNRILCTLGLSLSKYCCSLAYREWTLTPCGLSTKIAIFCAQFCWNSQAYSTHHIIFRFLGSGRLLYHSWQLSFRSRCSQTSSAGCNIFTRRCRATGLRRRVLAGIWLEHLRN